MSKRNTGNPTPADFVSQSKIISTSVFERQYLTSALTTRIFTLGLSESKNLKKAVHYLRHLDKKYQGMNSPFYFDKVVKHSGKYFWNPFIPVFYTPPFERYINNEFEQAESEVATDGIGVGVVDFTSCVSKSRLNTAIDLLITSKQKISPSFHKLYIKWNFGHSMDYVLGKFLQSLDEGCEPWLVIDAENNELNFKLFREKGLRGVVINISDNDMLVLSQETDIDKEVGLAKLIHTTREAMLITGINGNINDPDTEHLQRSLKRLHAMHAQFVIWNEGDSILASDSDTVKLNKVQIERTFLKSNSTKEYGNLPIVFYPSFYKKLNPSDNMVFKKCAYLTFETGLMKEERIPFHRFFTMLLHTHVPNKITRETVNNDTKTSATMQSHVTKHEDCPST